MERLIYTNALGQAVIFDESGLLRWLEVDDLGGLEADFMTSTGPFQDGATSVGDAYFTAKAIKVKFAVVSSELDIAIRSLNSILNPKLGLGKLTYERGGKSYVLNKVKTRSMPTLPGSPSRGMSYQITSAVFEAFDPYYTDEDYLEASVSTGENCLEFPVNIFDSFVFDFTNTTGILVTNGGDVDCPVTVILDGPKNSPLTVENLDTGEKIVLAMSLLETERLTITTGIDDINVIKEDLITGISTVAFQYIDVAETSFFRLPRGTSTLLITAGEAEVEQATIKYKQRWVGI